MLYQVITYLQWLPKTFYLHGIHSPFVFELEKKCLKKQITDSQRKKLKAYKTTLLNSTKTIEVTDFGAGSRVFTSNTRKVKDIARHAGATQKRMELLYQIVHYLQPPRILELGTSLGTGTFAMAQGNPAAHITTLEGCPETAFVAKSTLAKHHVSNVDVVEGRFRESIQNLLPTTFDCIYFDGNHSQKATLAYIKQLLPTVTPKTVWIFDDIHWSKDMTTAWKKICSLPDVTVSIDCYYFGLVFFRTEQQKEHFYIRT